MNNNIAIIDLGSNLTKVVILQNALPLTVIHRSIYDTKTLKNASKGFFDDVVTEKIEADIEQILLVTKKYNCNVKLGIATSAFRTRKNGQDVITNINKKFGANIEIIEGNREAFLIHKGAIASVTPKKFPILVMDIGGGSTEFIIGNETEIIWKRSFDFGSTALIKDVLISNPITENEIALLNQKLEHLLEDLFSAILKHQPTEFIGTTGAFESFAQIIESNKGNDSLVDSGYNYQISDLNKVLDSLIKSSVVQRESTKGLNPLRVSTINIASVILRFFLNKTHFNNYYLSLGDVKEGLGLEYLEQQIINS